MHYIWNLFIEPGDGLDDRIAKAMAPQAQGFWSPGGYGHKIGDYGLEYFMYVPFFEKHYNDYLGSVPPETLVVAIDVHC